MIMVTCMIIVILTLISTAMTQYLGITSFMCTYIYIYIRIYIYIYIYIYMFCSAVVKLTRAQDICLYASMQVHTCLHSSRCY